MNKYDNEILIDADLTIKVAESMAAEMLPAGTAKLNELLPSASLINRADIIFYAAMALMMDAITKNAMLGHSEEEANKFFDRCQDIFAKSLYSAKPEILTTAMNEHPKICERVSTESLYAEITGVYEQARAEAVKTDFIKE